MIKKSKKLITGLLLAVSLTATIPSTNAFAWTIQENKQYVDFLINDCKELPNSNRSLFEKDGKIYLLGFDGNSLVKPEIGGDRFYYIDADGCLVKNIWGKDEDGWHYYGSDYNAVKGFQTIDGKYYYFNPYGDLRTGWTKHSADDNPRAYWKDKHWYYNGEDGAIKQGWLSYKGNWYYIYSDGLMAYDTTTPDGYHVDKNGVWVS